jgi:hypothetical protein
LDEDGTTRDGRTTNIGTKNGMMDYHWLLGFMLGKASATQWLQHYLGICGCDVNFHAFLFEQITLASLDGVRLRVETTLVVFRLR